MLNDAINGSFEAFAAVMVLNHCRVLYKEKMVRGVSVVSAFFFMAWGMWNMYYYPTLSQPLSFYGGVLVTIANVVYVGMLVRYRRREGELVGHRIVIGSTRVGMGCFQQK